VVGFTLIELLVTIAVLAILIALAVPSFTSLINSNRLAAQSNEMVASLQQARIEAVKQNRRATVCRSTAGNVCTAGAAGATWTRWITYVDLDNSGGPTAAEIVRVNTAKAPVQVTSTNSALTFRADGMVRTAAGALADNTFTVCIPTTQPVRNKRLVDLKTGSRVAITTPEGTGACP
jgi:type IV fimbrial biogenesis protein FimT